MQPLSFKACVQQAIVPMLVRYPIAFLACIYFIFVFKTGRFWDIQAALKLVIDVFSDLRNLKFFFHLWLVIFVGVIFYPYLRTRNPTYIKKQEAYEKWKVEKELKKSAQPDETES